MKKLIREDDKEGFVKLLGQRITVFCCRYIYTGELIGVYDDAILLKDPGIVYETGPFNKKEWGNMQKLPNEWRISRLSIESFGILTGLRSNSLSTRIVNILFVCGVSAVAIFVFIVMVWFFSVVLA